jgi:Fe-S cluster biosynthesis and repair protein YggX
MLTDDDILAINFIRNSYTNERDREYLLQRLKEYFLERKEKYSIEALQIAWEVYQRIIHKKPLQ